MVDVVRAVEGVEEDIEKKEVEGVGEDVKVIEVGEGGEGGLEEEGEEGQSQNQDQDLLVAAIVAIVEEDEVMAGEEQMAARELDMHHMSTFIKPIQNTVP